MMNGALVVDVASNSPAAKAGISTRDLVTKIDGAVVTGPQQVVDAVTAHKPGDTVTLTLVRRADGKSTDVTVTLGKNPSDAGKAWLGVSLAAGGPAGPGPGMGPRGVGQGSGPRSADAPPMASAPESAAL